MRKTASKAVTHRKVRKPTRAQVRKLAREVCVEVSQSPLAEDAGSVPLNAAALSPTLQARLDKEALVDKSLGHLRDLAVLLFTALGNTPSRALDKAEVVVRATGLHTVAMDEVNKASHYNQGKFEVIDVLDDMELDPYRFQVVKYLARTGQKDNMLTDLKKAQYYLNRLVRLTENGEGPLGQ